MKKVLAILSVLAIMAGAFAAAPTADALLVTTKIGPQEPVFVLSSVETTDVTTATTSTTYSAYKAATTDPEAAAVQPTASVPTAATVIADNLLIDNAQTVNFKIEQKGIARSNRTYTLIVSATDLQITTPVTDGTIATDEEFKVDLSSIELTAGTDKATEDKVVFAVDTSNKKKMTATYSGRVNDAAADVVTVGTFSVKWGKNAAARVGDYKAYVTLAITTV